MDKRDRFIAELRAAAASKGLSFAIIKTRGKGCHAKAIVGRRTTFIPSREIDPKTARKIRKVLGLD